MAVACVPQAQALMLACSWKGSMRARIDLNATLQAPQQFRMLRKGDSDPQKCYSLAVWWSHRP